MKELIRDRIDVLIDKAREGNARAQLKLAKCFYSGHLVEKSVDLAKYWAFKSLVGGCNSAAVFYKVVVDSKSYTVFKVCRCMMALATVEILCCVILAFVIVDAESLKDRFLITFGMAVLCVPLLIAGGALSRKIGRSLLGRNGTELGIIIGIIAVHILALFVVLRWMEVL